MSYILLREAYIMIQVEPQVIPTSATASFKFKYKAVSDVEDLPLPHMRVHTHISTSSYVDETFA